MHEITKERNATQLGILRAGARAVALALIVLWTALDGASSAAAQTVEAGSTLGALRVEAPQGCATSADIVARVHQRSSQIEFAADAPLVLLVRIEARVKGGVLAELQIAWPDGHRSSRSLSAATCAEATDALALLITLALDPNARVDATRAAPAESDGAAAGAPSPAPSAARAEASETVAKESASAEPESTPLEDGEEDDGDQRSTDPLALAHVGFGVAAYGAIGPAPAAAPGLSVSARVAWNGSGLWTPLLQLRVSRAWMSTERAAGIAEFRLDAAHLSACVVGLRLPHDALGAYACATGSLGSLSARGTETYDPQSQARLWASAGGELLFSAKLVGPLRLEAGIGLALPVRRDRFAFAPAVFHRVSSVVAEGQLGLLLQFP